MSSVIDQINRELYKPVFAQPCDDYLISQKGWLMIKDVLAGEEAIKRGGDKYLPIIDDPLVTDDVRAKRYDKYKKRATWFGATSRTLQALTGIAFSQKPLYEIAPPLDYLIDEADREGNPLDVLARRCLNYVMSYGRAGVLSNFRGDEVSIEVYSPLDIINWRITDGELTMLVLRDCFDVPNPDNFFDSYRAEQYTVLRIDAEGRVVTDAYSIIDGKTYTAAESVPMTKYGGVPLDEIPFVFVGSVNNDAKIDPSPIYDIASLNVAHYRNSADYEEASFITGQPTLWVSGVTMDWVSTVLKNKILLGSRGVIILPEGGNAGLLQGAPNTMPLEAMKLKEEQMRALGARLVEANTSNRTATDAMQSETAALSVLGVAANNVSAGLTEAIRIGAEYVTDAESQDRVVLSTTYAISRLSVAQRQQIVGEWQAGAITFAEMRDMMRGNYELGDDELALELSQQGAATQPVPPTNLTTGQ